MSVNQTRPWAAALALALAVAAAFGLGAALRHALPVGVSVVHADETTAAAYDGPWAMAERQIVGNEERGAIRVGDQAVLEIQTSAGGLTGYERSLIVAKRLNDALVAGVKADEIHAGSASGMSVLQAGNTVLITVNAQEAERQLTTVSGLAATWAQALGRALGGTPSPHDSPAPITPAPTTPTADNDEVEPTPVEGNWTPPEPYKDKIVPILSVLEGVKIGAARVNGPTSKVDQVQAVAQLETDYEKLLRISVYVPISTAVPGSKLARVQGVGVTALADLRIR